MTSDDRLITLLQSATQTVQDLEQLPMPPAMRRFVHQALLGLISAIAYAAPRLAINDEGPAYIRLLSPVGRYPAGAIVRVASVVPHGGHYDCSHQYVLADSTHIPSDKAEPYCLANKETH